MDILSQHAQLPPLGSHPLSAHPSRHRPSPDCPVPVALPPDGAAGVYLPTLIPPSACPTVSAQAPVPGSEQLPGFHGPNLNPRLVFCNSPTRTTRSGLQAPPRIVNIAPTPVVSPAVTAPPSPVANTSPLQYPPVGVVSAHHLSPFPNLLSCDPKESSPLFSLGSPLISSPCHNNAISSPRPPLEQRYSSGSASASSLGFKSPATSPSLEDRDERQERPVHSPSDNFQIPSHSKPAHPSAPPSHRRASSRVGFKSKRKSASYARTISASSARSFSPRVCDSSSSRSLGRRSFRDKTVVSQASPHEADIDNNLSTTRPPDSSATVIANRSNVFSQPRSGPGTSPRQSQLCPRQLGFEPSRDGRPHDRSRQDKDDSTTGSIASVDSPVIPVTPNNSQASAPCRHFPGATSAASSQTTGRSSAFLPSAPPPTPAGNGVPLPTTMSAGLSKSKITEVASDNFAATTTLGGGLAKKKAAFYINGYETEEEGVLSPISGASHNGAPHVHELAAHLPSQRSTGPARSIILARKSLAHINQSVNAQANNEAENEELNDSDSDEWGSEYSDDDGEEGEEEATERLRQEELERKKQQEEYHRHLFAKKHFVQRDPSDPKSGAATPIRRAGLSMLFHPELNHLQHHPKPSGSVEAKVRNLRNQSAVELRQRLRGACRPSETGAGEAEDTTRKSFNALPRPSSLIKSKSSIAVPVLASHEPPEMVERSPSAYSGGSSVPRCIQRPAPATSGSGKQLGLHPGLGPGVSSNRPAALGHQRHPSRLGAKPENVEYSDDDDSEEEFESREEQERKLGRLALAGRGGITITGVRPEPIAHPLSPRTTRRNMLANEMTESVRRNLLWERQIRTQCLGIVLGHGQSDGRCKEEGFKSAEGGITALSGKAGEISGKNGNSSSGISQKAKYHQQKYRNSSNGFHRTGW